MQTSTHARRRCAQRCIDAQSLRLARRYGRKLHRTGVVFYFVGRRDIPEKLRGEERFARLEGLTLLVGADGELITAYRNKAALRQIRKKTKYRLVPEGSFSPV